MFFRATFHSTRNKLVFTTVTNITAVEHEEITIVPHNLRIRNGTGTAAKRQIINRVKQVCLTLAVMPDEAIKLRRKSQLCLGDILIIQYR